jgi:hypothetical protein
MGLKEWWESRQQQKHDHENEKLLELAEHPHGDINTSGTDLDEYRTDLGNSRLNVGGETSPEEIRKIE